MNRNKRFIERIAKRMQKNGYNCSVKGENILIRIGEKCFEVCVSDAKRWGRRKINVNLYFAFDTMNEVEPIGLLWLASESNNCSKNITTRVWSDHFSCQFDTMVYSSKDFMKEFAIAFNEIGETYKNIAGNYIKVHDNYKIKENKRRPIGFLADKYMDVEEKEEACKLVAQTDCNFAADNKNDLYMKELKKKANFANKVEKQYCDHIREAAETANIAESEYAKQKRVSKQNKD